MSRERVDGDLLVTEIACLVGGRWATLRAGLVMLHKRGLLNSNRRGRIERVGSSPRDGALSTVDGFEI
jgi:hypothetical protein